MWPNTPWNKGKKLEGEKYKGGRKNKGKKRSAQFKENAKNISSLRKHTEAEKQKLRDRPKEIYKKPKATPIATTELCQYNCGQIAKYSFANGKLCCSTSHNSCPGKKKQFSDMDHTERTAKSLATRLEKGITKSCQIKGAATRKAAGFYEKHADIMRQHWIDHPWDNNTQCPILPYKNIDLVYQGTYEFEFLEGLEEKHGIEWIKQNVLRGPSVWYFDSEDNTKRLYISDFIIYNTI